MAKYIVRVGSNAPDPSGKRDLKGRPVEVRFEEGDEITDQSVTPKDLATLIKTGAIEPSTDAGAAPTFTASITIEDPPAPLPDGDPKGKK
jgi:hypothetical protein